MGDFPVIVFWKTAELFQLELSGKKECGKSQQEIFCVANTHTQN